MRCVAGETVRLWWRLAAALFGMGNADEALEVGRKCVSDAEGD